MIIGRRLGTTEGENRCELPRNVEHPTFTQPTASIRPVGEELEHVLLSKATVARQWRRGVSHPAHRRPGGGEPGTGDQHSAPVACGPTADREDMGKRLPGLAWYHSGRTSRSADESVPREDCCETHASGQHRSECHEEPSELAQVPQDDRVPVYPVLVSLLLVHYRHIWLRSIPSQGIRMESMAASGGFRTPPQVQKASCLSPHRDRTMRARLTQALPVDEPAGSLWISCGELCGNLGTRCVRKYNPLPLRASYLRERFAQLWSKNNF